MTVLDEIHDEFDDRNKRISPVDQRLRTSSMDTAIPTGGSASWIRFTSASTIHTTKMVDATNATIDMANDDDIIQMLLLQYTQKNILLCALQ